ncbi:MAG: ATP-binding cassette domain-containing protein [Candidatus Gastranaerophilales bacterium]|nr:ATP-binding cassette domain-containing protein [Candidatus Gastranaerophilales bacterium]
MTVKIENLTKKFGDKVILNNISFTVNTGEILAIVGFSGSGKSTVLKLITGLLEADSGTITTDKHGEIAMVFQYSALFDSLNVFDNITFALQERKEFKGKYSEEQLKEMVAQKLETVGLKNIEEKFPYELSGGMQKRVSFARAIMTEPTLILYDEPTAGLDPVASTIIEDYIVRLRNETHSTAIVVTHQLSTIKRCADRVIMLYHGDIVFTGTPEELESMATPYTKQFMEASVEGPMQINVSDF